MPRSPEQFGRIREESRERILAAALRLFAHAGYEATPVRSIAAEAGVAQGLLYNYFAGKEALLHAIFARSMERVQSTFEAAAGASTPEEGVGVLVRSAFRTVREHQEFWRLSYQLRMQPEVLTGLGEAVHGWSAAIVARLETLLHEAAAPGAGVAARALFAAIDGAAQHFVLDPERYPLDAVADEIVRRFAPAPSP